MGLQFLNDSWIWQADWQQIGSNAAEAPVKYKNDTIMVTLKFKILPDLMVRCLTI